MSPTIAILGAGGLIGQAVGEGLRRRGFPVVALARHLTPAQEAAFAPDAVTAPLADLDVPSLERLLAECGADVVVNCLGVLQDAPGASTRDVHEGFVLRLIEAVGRLQRPALLVHLSMPGREADDATCFSRTKRAAERSIVSSGKPYLILRPGFVIAPAAFGGSALLRALAMLPLDLAPEVAGRPFAATAVDDITASIEVVSRRWAVGDRDWGAVWEVSAAEPSTVGDVLATLRRRLGGPRPLIALPAWTMRLGALCGDLAARLGWAPPLRSTALAEMRRGVETDPAHWTNESGLSATSLAAAVAGLPATVQERWFARLFLVKPLIIGTLASFWIVSGLVSLTVAFQAASGLLAAMGFPKAVADVVTAATSLLDIAIGLGVAHRRSCAVALLAGIGVSLGYLGAAAILAPGLWIDPLGPLVKTVPAIMLMLVALLILDAR